MFSVFGMAWQFWKGEVRYVLFWHVLDCRGVAAWARCGGLGSVELRHGRLWQMRLVTVRRGEAWQVLARFGSADMVRRGQEW